jgi:hypothetical protein
MLNKLMIALIMSVILVGCGGTPDQAVPTLAPADDGGEVESTTEDGAASDTADSGEAGADEFTVTVSGDIAGEMQSGITVDVCASQRTVISHSNTFLHNDEEPVGSLTLTFNPEATPGEYAPSDDGTFPVVDLTAYIEPRTEDGANYASSDGWTVTLEQVASAPGEAYVGSYTIDLTNFDIINNTPATGSVTVTGTFNHVVDELCTA